MTSVTVIVSLVFLVICVVSLLPVIIFEKQKKETKKNYKVTRIYTYVLASPVFLLLHTLVFEFKEFTEQGGWLIIGWIIYYPIALFLIFVPLSLDEILTKCFQNSNKKE